MLCFYRHFLFKAKSIILVLSTHSPSLRAAMFFMKSRGFLLAALHVVVRCSPDGGHMDINIKEDLRTIRHLGMISVGGPLQ